jgi:hypothetical protein
MERPDYYSVRLLHTELGISLVECNNAMALCNGDYYVAKEYLKLKRNGKHEKRVRGKWVPWTEKDYVEAAKGMVGNAGSR